MNDTFDLAERPSAAELDAARAEIIAFREANPTLTRTGLAVAFVEKRGSATSGELSILLNLRADQYPSVELSSAVQNGRLMRDGKDWTLGPKKIAYQEAHEQPERSGKPALAIPTFSAAATPTGAPAPAPELAPKKSGCKFAIWSHGVVEIKKPAMPALELTLDEVDELIAFLTKMGNA